MTPTFALVDCNNFYATCETLFRPDLRGRPLVVLSNNDGCVVARSAEAKALGIRMAVPVFQIRDQLRRHRVEIFSSNYALYADMSARVMSTLEQLAPAVEIYSIDEAFLDLSGVAACRSLETLGQDVRQTVRRHTGVMVCVGMAPTKTLAKLANHAAKRYRATGGVVDLTDPARQRRLMDLLPVEEVWGVGNRLAARLRAQGVDTVLKLADCDPAQIQRHYSVVLARTVRELNGESCLSLEQVAPAKKQIVCSRSFGQRVTTLSTLRGAVARHVWRAGEKLRQGQQLAGQISVFARTSPFSPGKPFYSQSLSACLPVPTDDSGVLMDYAQRLLGQLWRDGYDYAKTGIMLCELMPRQGHQPSLLDSPFRHDDPRRPALMDVLDRINASGKGRVHFAREYCGQHHWQMTRGRLSPAYTTRWSDIPRVV